MKKRIALLFAALLMLTLSALAEDYPRFESLSDAREYLNEQVLDCPETIVFYLTGVTGDDIDTEFCINVRDLAGQYRATVHRSGEEITVTYEYYPGMRILHAVRANDSSDLTDDEKRAMTVAVDVAQHALDSADTAYDAVLYLHDWLCANVNYEAMPENSDTLPRVCGAVGALVDGRANCQGYADAFRLLGNLVGLDVRKQAGDDDDGEGHDWNVVLLSGEWYIVDVTHDDVNDSEAWHYAYMNVGCDLCTYTWDEEYAAAPVSESTNADLWYYSRNSRIYNDLDSLTWDAYFARRDDGVTVFRGMIPYEKADWEKLSDAIKSLADQRGKKCSWYIWATTSSGNAYYWLEWTEW